MISSPEESFLPGVTRTSGKCEEPAIRYGRFELVAIDAVLEERLGNRCTAGPYAVRMEMDRDPAMNTEDCHRSRVAVDANTGVCELVCER